MPGLDAPASDWITTQPRQPLPLFTLSDVHELEASYKRTCAEQVGGATVVGFLGGLLFSATVVAVLSF